MSGIAGNPRPVASLLAALLLSACSAGGGGGEVPEGPPRGLAATPGSLSPAPFASAPAGATSGPSASPGASGVATASPGAAATTAPPAGPGGTPGATPTRSDRPAAATVLVGRAEDRAGDAEGAGPAYADLRAVHLGSDGTNLHVSFTMAGPLPARVAAEETFGAGLDLFRSIAQIESDYQLFVDGSPDGWFAYLHGPSGYVRYPGTFQLGGSQLAFVLPWSAVGGMRSGRFSAFADWTRDAPGANPFSEDHAPDLGTAAYG